MYGFYENKFDFQGDETEEWFFFFFKINVYSFFSHFLAEANDKN